MISFYGFHSGRCFYSVKVSIVNIYFHFQLLTNLASVAAKYQSEDYELDEELLRYRTLQTIMLTAVILLSYLAKWLDGFGTFVSICMIIVYLIAGILLMKALFDLRRCLPIDTHTGTNADADAESEDL